jgi:hypothetical protein
MNYNIKTVGINRVITAKMPDNFIELLKSGPMEIKFPVMIESVAKEMKFTYNTTGTNATVQFDVPANKAISILLMDGLVEIARALFINKNGML